MKNEIAQFRELLQGLPSGKGKSEGSLSSEDALRLIERAERAAKRALSDLDREMWHLYLDRTRRSPFLLSLPDREARERWAENTFAIIDRTEYRLEEVWKDRLDAHPDRVLFQEGWGRETRRWSYAQAARRIRSIAAALLSASEGPPRVALFTENCPEGAFTDLACLTYDIFVTPLDPHMNEETLRWVFEELRINIVVIDTELRRSRVEAVRSAGDLPLRILFLDPEVRSADGRDGKLAELSGRLSPREIDERIAGRSRIGMHETATIMFTSGSTGRPKGVVFTPFHLLTKRFARAAALPRVGEEEVLLCYLPLFHTFGRYLEMMGMLFWGGTYVFAGNPSIETLLSGLKSVRPTGLIGIPRRWAQIREKALADAGENPVTPEGFRAVVGDRLRFGLSAAGYLDPKVFHLFQKMGVDLCSGFGMTEATGGITMTPPGEYEDNTVGIPLPGVRCRLTEEGELQISGVYVARYLDEPEQPGEGEYWLSTGDIFQERPSGYLEIVDRIKDIYKNSRGQTVAPRRVEQKFVNVPGIKTTFLVGDGRDYNVLLIVRDPTDPVLFSMPGEESLREYYHQIVTAANGDLAPYERVVNFAVLERDFDADRGELTPKGSFRRKRIEENFAGVILDLYQSDHVDLALGGFTVRIPRWFYRDLSILENDIEPCDGGIRNRRSRLVVAVRSGEGEGKMRIGDLEYTLAGTRIDLGRMARQPLLWLGNPSLVRFAPCKEGWDTSLGPFADHVLLPWGVGEEGGVDREKPLPPAGGRRLSEVNRLAVDALFGEEEQSLAAVAALQRELRDSHLRLGNVIRRRLEALARHPAEEVRCLAYRVLLLDEPVPDYGEHFPAFIYSGLSFLNEKSIEAVARANLEQRRLQALRRRLHTYRIGLEWPATTVVRSQFENMFVLLVNFVRYHPEYYATIRAELVSWIQHRADPALAAAAEIRFHELADWFEEELEKKSTSRSADAWNGRIVVQDGLGAEEVRRLEEVLVGTTFLEESVLLAFDGETFDIFSIPPEGIWISRVLSLHNHRLYRVSINTVSEKHYDLLVMFHPDMEERSVHETNYWLIAIHGFPYGQPAVPRFGCCRPELGVLSLAFVGDLTLWDLVREFAVTFESRALSQGWQNLFVRAMAAFFGAWKNSEGRIVPGAVTPRNVAVAEPDYREGATILSLAGTRQYAGPLSLVAPMIRNFFLEIRHHYPKTRFDIELSWIFDAAVEALGKEEGALFLEELARDLVEEKVPGNKKILMSELAEFRTRLDKEYHVPVPVSCAIERYRQWEELSPMATAAARERNVTELFRLYRVERFGPIARYYLYRQTYFAAAAEALRAAFDHLLDRMLQDPGERPTRMVELSELQAQVTDDEDRMVFSRLVFPRAPAGRPLEVVAVGDREEKQVIVRTQITDNLGETYTVRDPIEPAEVGQLIRLIIQGGFPNIVSQRDRYYVTIDEQERIVGGVFYEIEEPTVAHLDGIVVSGPLKHRGISGALLEDFCTRMAGQGVETITTHFFARPFYVSHGFHVDKRYGGLVRFLTEPE